MIWTLSGFLGLPSDWDFLPWVHRSLVPRQDATGPAAGDVLIGYSMGGRLALLELERRKFRAAVIVSAGLNAPDEARRRGDEEWARRFETEDWSTLMRDWSAQPVLRGHAVDRFEGDYERAELARQLREWSPAVLPPPRLEAIETPVLWVVGERDAKFLAMAKAAVVRVPGAELWVCPGAGHRVPWEQPEALVARLHDFLDLH